MKSAIDWICFVFAAAAVLVAGQLCGVALAQQCGDVACVERSCFKEDGDCRSSVPTARSVEVYQGEGNLLFDEEMQTDIIVYIWESCTPGCNTFGYLTVIAEFCGGDLLDETTEPLRECT